MYPKLCLYTNGIEYHNRTSAPWVSTEIFFQGCYKNCPACFNQELRSLNGGSKMSIGFIFDDLIKNVPYKKVTFSGGEPFIQAEALCILAERLREEGFIIVCYSGYTIEEIPHLFPYGKELLENIDILVDGPFIKELLTPIENEFDFVGSSNQRIIDVQKTLQQDKLVLYEKEEV